MNINFTSPINQLGYGVVGLNLFKGMIDAGHRISLWALPSANHIDAPVECHEELKDAIANQSSYDKYAPSIRHFHQFDLAQHVGKSLHVGSTVFELDRFNQMEITNLSNQDAICVPSKWAKCVIENNIKSNVPIIVMPYGVDRFIFNETIKYKDSKTTTFINIGKWEIRKGHDVLVEMFNSAFEKTDKVKLILSCNNPFYSKQENIDWAMLYKNSKLGDKIEIIENRLPLQEQVSSLMASADCGVFPSRAEGWGLESLEMMAMGKHVILTNYSGHTEYANNETSLLIDIDELEDAYDGKWFFGQGQWASISENQIDQAVEHMRNVHRLKQSGSLGVNESGIEVSKRFSWDDSVYHLIESIRDLM